MWRFIYVADVCLLVCSHAMRGLCQPSRALSFTLSTPFHACRLDCAGSFRLCLEPDVRAITVRRRASVLAPAQLHLALLALLALRLEGDRFNAVGSVAVAVAEWLQIRACTAA